MPEKRGRGRGRRERDFSSRDEERALTRPRDTVKLFEFLQPQIGKEEEEEKEDDEEADWERDGIYRPPAERSHRGRDEDGGAYRGRGGPRGRRRGFNDDEGSYRGGSRGRRGGYRHEEDEGDRSYRGGSRGRRGGYRDEDDGRSYRGRGRRSDSGRGGRGRSSFRGSSYYEEHSQRRAPSIENLVEDFTAWPGLGPADPEEGSSSRPSTSNVVNINPGPKAESWAVDDYCLAKWETTEQVLPNINLN